MRKYLLPHELALLVAYLTLVQLTMFGVCLLPHVTSSGALLLFAMISTMLFATLPDIAYYGRYSVFVITSLSSAGIGVAWAMLSECIIWHHGDIEKTVQTALMVIVIAILMNIPVYFGMYELENSLPQRKAIRNQKRLATSSNMTQSQ